MTFFVDLIVYRHLVVILAGLVVIIASLVVILGILVVKIATFVVIVKLWNPQNMCHRLVAKSITFLIFNAKE